MSITFTGEKIDYCLGPGTIIGPFFDGSFTPAGTCWVRCDGKTYRKSELPELVSAFENAVCPEWFEQFLDDDTVTVPLIHGCWMRVKR